MPIRHVYSFGCNALPHDEWRDNWTGTVSGIIPNYCIQASNAHVVTVTWSDGTLDRFQPTVSPACQQIVPLSQTTFNFTPGAPIPPNATLAIGGNNSHS